VRIIAGEFRGRKLLPPSSQQTRPITDRAKQSLFDVLAPVIPDAVVYDCFSGTGSMGLEALSRGAARAVFFERDRSAVRALRRNIELLGVAARSRIVSCDLFEWFNQSLAGEGPADLVFLDPPYRFLSERSRDLETLAQSLATHHLSPLGIVAFRHDSRDRLELLPLVRYDERSYGGMTIEFLRRPQTDAR
jgi:16S rRNA (guanine966-N2)-methyltransferase